MSHILYIFMGKFSSFREISCGLFRPWETIRLMCSRICMLTNMSHPVTHRQHPCYHPLPSAPFSMFDAGLADELGKRGDPFLTAGAPGPQPIEKEIHYAFAPELRTELGGCNHRFAGHGNDTVSSGDHGRDGSRSKDMDAFLLVPMPEDQILPVPRISHDSRLDDGNSSSASSPARPASIQISSCPLVRLPHSPALPPSFRLAAGHVLRSAVTSHAYRIIRSLIPASSHSPYRHPTALYLATPFPSKPLSLGPRRSGIYPSCQTGDPDMSRLSQSKCVVIKVGICLECRTLFKQEQIRNFKHLTLLFLLLLLFLPVDFHGVGNNPRSLLASFPPFRPATRRVGSCSHT